MKVPIVFLKKKEIEKRLEKAGWTFQNFDQYVIENQQGKNIYIAGCSHDELNEDIVRKFVELQEKGFCTLVLENWADTGGAYNSTQNVLLQRVLPTTRVRLMDSRKIVLKDAYLPTGQGSIVSISHIYHKKCPPEKHAEAIQFMLEHWVDISQGNIEGTPSQVQTLLRSGMLDKEFEKQKIKLEQGNLADVSGFLFDSYAVAGALAPWSGGGLPNNVMIVCGKYHVPNMYKILNSVISSPEYPSKLKRTQDELYYIKQAMDGLLSLPQVK